MHNFWKHSWNLFARRYLFSHVVKCCYTTGLSVNCNNNKKNLSTPLSTLSIIFRKKSSSNSTCFCFSVKTLCAVFDEILFITLFPYLCSITPRPFAASNHVLNLHVFFDYWLPISAPLRRTGILYSAHTIGPFYHRSSFTSNFSNLHKKKTILNYFYLFSPAVWTRTTWSTARHRVIYLDNVSRKRNLQHGRVLMHFRNSFGVHKMEAEYFHANFDDVFAIKLSISSI